MPCWERFERQDEAYRLIADRSTVRVAVGAAVRQGWERYIGEHVGFVGMSGFGALESAPDLFIRFGITPGSVDIDIRDRL